MGKQTKLTKSARGEECQVRIQGVCNRNPETTVLAHLNGGGAGMKNQDFLGAYACSDCHDAVDHRSNKKFSNEFILIAHYEGMVRTQKIMHSKGLLVTT